MFALQGYRPVDFTARHLWLCPWCVPARQLPFRLRQPDGIINVFPLKAWQIAAWHLKNTAVQGRRASACVNKQAAILDIDIPTRAIMVNNVSVKIDGQLKGWGGLVRVSAQGCE